MPESRFPASFNAADALMWNMERDPQLRSTIVAVSVLETAPDWERLYRRFDRASRVLPRMRQRVVPVPLRIGPPRWVYDPHFDLAYHVRRAVVPPPGDFGAVLEFARVAGMAAFDPHRPLWEFTVLDGLDGGGAALVMKLHHSLTDGVGAVQLALQIYDLSEQATSDEQPMPPAPGGEQVEPGELLADAAVDAVRAGTRLAIAGGQRLFGALGRLVRDPAAAVDDASRTLSSVGRLLAPISDTKSPVMTGRSTGWQYRALDVPFSALRRAARAAGGTVNDAFVAGVAGGLARYHDKHGATVSSLRMTMPVNLRSADDAPGGNRFTPLRFEVPIGLADPLERMRRIDEVSRAMRDEPAVPLTPALAAILNRLPVGVMTNLFGGMLKHVDFVTSDVPGSTDPLWLAGSKVRRMVAFAPAGGAATNVTLLSYAGTCGIGITSDLAAIPDADLFAECVADGFAEVAAIG